MNSVFAPITAACLMLSAALAVGWFCSHLTGVVQASAPVTTIPTATQPLPGNQWSADLAARLGNSQPSADTIAFLNAWQAGENTAAQFNPLATTQLMDGSTPFNDNNGQPVQNYLSYIDGIEATAITLNCACGGSAYVDIREGIRLNDPERALRGLHASLWGTNPDVVEQIYRAHLTLEVTKSYVLQGDVGVNVRAALNANNGRLRKFTVQPGEVWSFGHSIAPISLLGPLPVVCGPAGCFEGGGWCDLAAMYMQVADQIGLQTAYPQHIGVAVPFPGILLDENGNGGDLHITNTTNQQVIFTATESSDGLTVAGAIQ